jgi:predicted nucleic acid-binding protein
VTLFVDTSVWSLAFRRDGAPDLPEVRALANALRSDETVLTTGLVIQELLQGFSGPKARDRLLDQLSALPIIMPDLRDHVEAAGLRNDCRRKGLQVGTIDSLLAGLCIRHELMMLSADTDFRAIAKHSKLKLWSER